MELYRMTVRRKTHNNIEIGAKILLSTFSYTLTLNSFAWKRNRLLPTWPLFIMNTEKQRNRQTDKSAFDKILVSRVGYFHENITCAMLFREMISINY
jgi:hypothetical protein